jgi:hypothetical protein
MPMPNRGLMLLKFGVLSHSSSSISRKVWFLDALPRNVIEIATSAGLELSKEPCAAAMPRR